MAKPFTEMTDFEKLVNRRRLAAGQPADWTESVDRDLVAKVDAAARRRRIEAADADAVASFNRKFPKKDS